MEDKKVYTKITNSSLYWGVGYVGFWAAKWIISSIVLSDNVVLDAIKRFMLRSSIEVEIVEQEATFWGTIVRNTGVFWHRGYLVFAIVCAIMILVIKKKYKLQIMRKKVLPYIFLALIPIGWYVVTTNHSTEHYWMTWRNAAIVIMCIITGIVKSLKKNEN